MDTIQICAKCRYPIYTDWITVDDNGDRENPSYYHIGCKYPQEEKPNAGQKASEQSGTYPDASQIPLFLCRLSKADRAALRTLGVKWYLFT